MKPRHDGSTHHAQDAGSRRDFLGAALSLAAAPLVASVAREGGPVTDAAFAGASVVAGGAPWFETWLKDVEAGRCLRLAMHGFS